MVPLVVGNWQSRVGIRRPSTCPTTVSCSSDWLTPLSSVTGLTGTGLPVVADLCSCYDGGPSSSLTPPS